MKNITNIGRIPGKLYVGFLKVVGHFNMPWYLDRYVNYLKRQGMDIKGMPQFIAPSVHFDGKDYSIIHIGDKTVISKNVEFLTHDYSIARALEAIGEDMTLEAYFLRDIVVGNNCFVGLGSILMPGCTIGDNCIIGAGSVVRGDIPSNSIVIGNPQQIVGSTIEWARKKQQQGNFRINVSRTH
ncbi:MULTISPECIES: DapH/DapD/GlmU-related protein [unclassified Adlercreutzia]|uniref:acyltransferase n=1 Tax=unclassified Adlercreutzia TaxID=2636013 RepID=UPI0013EAF72E|nr:MULTISPECIES: acyltransferase [unclassified Adlercreutzia]